MRRHEAIVHDIGGTTHTCKLCPYSTKNSSDLRRHGVIVHDIGGTTHTCNHCPYSTKNGCDLRRHEEHVHDIGPLTCDWCFQNRHLLRGHRGSRVCRACFFKDTGKNTRVEKVWSEFLEERFGTVGLLASDRCLSAVGGCSQKRPDKLWTSNTLIEIDECDEHQHSMRNGNYTCEESRLLEICTDIVTSFPGVPIVVTRWNPHTYTPAAGTPKLPLQRRLEVLAQVKQAYREEPPEAPLTVVYMFYDHTNNQIMQNFPVHMVCSENDVATLRV
jgi:hypothetical protein